MYRYAVFGRLRNLKSGAAPHPFRGGAPILKVPEAAGDVVYCGWSDFTKPHLNIVSVGSTLTLTEGSTIQAASYPPNSSHNFLVALPTKSPL